MMSQDLLTTRLITSGKQRPLGVAQVVCPLVPVCDVWRLTDPDSFFDLFESLIILPVSHLCPFPIDGMVNMTGKKHGISVSIQPRYTLRKSLVHPKDKVEKENTCDVVYETCATI